MKLERYGEKIGRLATMLWNEWTTRLTFEQLENVAKQRPTFFL